jgi:hypothetical protein
MREPHPVFIERVEPAEPIWRYFDFPKFVSLLNRRALYFSRADLLGDPLEGSFTKAREAERQCLLDNPPEGQTREDLEAIFRHNEAIVRQGPYCVYVNCWHLGNHESMAMWQGYGSGPYGVAVRSTFGLLDELLPERFTETGREEPVFLGRVRYLDYSSHVERIPAEYNLYAPFLCKSIAYRRESEIRAVFADIPGGMQKTARPGYFVPVDLARLVETVTVSPLAPSWFADLVRDTCTQFGFGFTVTSSIVTVVPIY